MRKPVRSTVANRKYFQGGGLAPMKPAAPEEAVGIMASSQPLVDMVAQSAGNPQGGMSPLNFNQGGLANVPVPQGVPKSRIRRFGEGLGRFFNPFRVTGAGQTVPALQGMYRYFKGVPTDPVLKEFGIDQFTATEIAKNRFPGQEAEVEKIARSIISETPGIKPEALGKQITQKLSATSKTEAEKIMDEKFDKEAKEANQKVMPPVFPEIDPISKEEKAESKKLIDEAKQEQAKKNAIVKEQNAVEGVEPNKTEDETVSEETNIINQNVVDDQKTSEDRLGMLMKRFTDAAPEYEGVDKGLALMQMGALMAGGTSPNAIKNIADALAVTSEKLIADDSKRKQFNQQLQLSALQYGLGEISKLDADERARKLFEFQKSFEFENFYDQNNNLVQVSKADLAKNGLPTEDKNGNPIELKTSDFIKNLMDKNAAIQTQNLKVLKELNVSSKELGDFQKEYGTAVDKTIKATNTMRLLESIITKNVEGELTGFKPAFKDLLSKAAAAGGVDINRSYETKAEGIADLKVVLQNMIPLTLGKDQSANSISNFDVNMLAEALFTDAVRTGGIFDSLTTTPRRVLDKKLRTTYGILEDNRLSTINTLNSLEQRGAKFIVGLDPNQTLGSQVASERERLQPYLEGVKGVTGLELPTLEFNKDTNVYKIPGLK